MKKLFAAFCITLCLLFSGAAVSVKADGNGHIGGRSCTETVNCPPDNNPTTPPPLPLAGSTSDSTDEATTAEDTFLTLLELIIRLLP